MKHVTAHFPQPPLSQDARKLALSGERSMVVSEAGRSPDHSMPVAVYATKRDFCGIWRSKLLRRIQESEYSKPEDLQTGIADPAWTWTA